MANAEIAQVKVTIINDGIGGVDVRNSGLYRLTPLAATRLVAQWYGEDAFFEPNADISGFDVLCSADSSGRLMTLATITRV